MLCVIGMGTALPSPVLLPKALVARRHLRPGLLLALAIFAGAGAISIHAAAPLQIPVLVVATYETGNDTGDVPGELQYWAERQNLTQKISVPGLQHPLLTNGKGLYAMVCGTTSRCVVQLMALGMNPDFDLRRTYVMVSGIAGGDPSQISLASAAWIDYAVDDNPAFEIDGREIPKSWPNGLVAFGATEPGKGSRDVDNVPAAGASDNGVGGVGTVAFKLNPELVSWAYNLTKSVSLPDDAGMAKYRNLFDEPTAKRPPCVMVASALAGDRFWHGIEMEKWARSWVSLYTRGKGTFTISDCEDAGVCIAFQALDRIGKVDFSRLLILRTTCNFVVPPPGSTAAEGLFGKTVSESSGTAYLPSLESNYRIGNVVVQELLSHWDTYRDKEP
jgi:purine nucleoside permease